MPYFLLIFALLLPLFGALTLPLVFRLAPEGLRKHYPAFLIFCSFSCCASLTALAFSAARPYDISLSFPPSFDIAFTAGPLTSLLALSLSFGCLASLIKINNALHSIAEKNTKEYLRFNMAFILFSSFLSAMALSGSLLWIFIFWQLAMLSLWAMSGHSSSQEDNMKSDAMLVRLIAGSLFMLAGITLIYMNHGTFLLENLIGESVSASQAMFFIPPLLMPVILYPGTFRVTIAGETSPSSDYLLPAFMALCASLCVFSKLFCSCLATPEIFYKAMDYVSAAGIILMSWDFFAENDRRRQAALLAAILFFFIILGMTSRTNMGFAGSLLMTCSFIPAATGLMIMCGMPDNYIISKKGKAAFLLCALSLAGMPPTAGFFSRLMFFGGIAQNGNTFLLALSVTVSGLLIFALVKLYGSFPSQKTVSKEKESFPIHAAMLLGIIGIILGLFIYYPSSYAVLTAAIQGVNLQ